MAIYISQIDPAQAGRFKSSHWVHTQVANNKHLVTLTGIVLTDFKGTGQNWRRDRIEFALRFPTSFIPTGRWFQVEHWAPFVTINAISNQHHAVNAGWAVDQFGGPGSVKIFNSVGIWADMAIRDIDGHLWRIGYTLTVSGVFTEPPLPVP